MEATILLVDDDPVAVRLVNLILDREGYETIVASDGSQGLKMAQDEGPDLVLLDLMLPGMNGLDVLRRLRADSRTADLPVIVVSAQAQFTDKHAALDVGANAYVTKPFRRAELLPLIRSLLEGLKQMEEPEEAG